MKNVNISNRFASKMHVRNMHHKFELQYILTPTQEENLLDSMHKHKPERRKQKISLLQAKG